ncbi:MAG: thiamine phosphate synthase [Pseudomonadota bacterium]|nr:thiamine phosphate synthase [Pseudomonadota bacterium]
MSLRGLYLITNDQPLPCLLVKLETMLATGAVALLQYRRKHTAITAQADEAAQVLAVCRRFGVPLIINDDVALAERLGCGVHLGQADGSLSAARQRLGADALIGRTCHDTLALAQVAADEGASYVAFGAVYPSSTKPNAQRVTHEILQQAVVELSLPICVIGGLTAENIQPLQAMGVSLYAVVSDIWQATDPVARLQVWQQQLTVTT